MHHRAEELIEHLPPEYREAFETQRQKGDHALTVADGDLKKLVRLLNACRQLRLCVTFFTGYGA